MTKEEAIEALKSIITYTEEGAIWNEALTLAIQSLEAQGGR